MSITDLLLAAILVSMWVQWYIETTQFYNLQQRFRAWRKKRNV